MQQSDSVAIFWDYESCPVSGSSGYKIATNIRNLAHAFGRITQFKAYIAYPPSSTTSQRALDLWAELQASGVSLVYKGSNDERDTSSPMMIVDMMAYAADHPAPAIMVVISGDGNCAYAIATLRLRKYQVVVVCPPNSNPALIAQASTHLDWNIEILGQSPPENLPVGNGNLEPPPSTPLRGRSSSLSGVQGFPSTPATSRIGKQQVEDDGDNDDDHNVYHPPRNVHRNSTYAAGRNGEPSLRHGANFSGSQSPAPFSWTAPKASSLPASFLSANSFQPSPVPPEKLAQSSLPPDHEHSLHGKQSFKFNLPREFPLYEPEAITLKPAAENPGVASSWSTRSSAPQTSPKAQKQFEVPDPHKFVLPPVTSFVPRLFTLTPGTPPFIPLAKSLKPATGPAPNSALSFKPPSVVGSPAPASVPAARPTQPVAPSSPSSSSSSTTPMVPRPSQAPSPSVPPAKSVLIQTPPKPTQPTSGAANTSAIPAVSTPPPMGLKDIPSQFQVLVDLLEARQRVNGQIRVARTEIGSDLSKHKTVYKLAGVTKFAAYIDLANKTGIVDLGGEGNDQWVMLRPEWSIPPAS